MLKLKPDKFIPAGGFPSFMKKKENKKPASLVSPSRRWAFFLIRKNQRIFISYLDEVYPIFLLLTYQIIDYLYLLVYMCIYPYSLRA